MVLVLILVLVVVVVLGDWGHCFFFFAVWTQLSLGSGVCLGPWLGSLVVCGLVGVWSVIISEIAIRLINVEVINVEI